MDRVFGILESARSNQEKGNLLTITRPFHCLEGTLVDLDSEACLGGRGWGSGLRFKAQPLTPEVLEVGGLPLSSSWLPEPICPSIAV